MNRYGTKIASVERDVAEITNMELIGVEWDGRNSLAWIWWWTTSSSSPSAAHPTAGVALPPPVDAALSSTDDASHTLSLPNRWRRLVGERVRRWTGDDDDEQRHRIRVVGWRWHHRMGRLELGLSTDAVSSASFPPPPLSLAFLLWIWMRRFLSLTKSHFSLMGSRSQRSMREPVKSQAPPPSLLHACIFPTWIKIATRHLTAL